MKKRKSSLMTLFRLGNWLYRHKCPLLPAIIQRYIRVIYSCDLPIETRIGTDTLFLHNGLGVVVHPQTIIGDRVKIYPNVILAGRNNRGTPTIENDVFIGPSACIMGGVTIGANSVIGSNSVVIDNIPPNSLVITKKAEIRNHYYDNK
jgi:serine O-acetyltransferase